MIRRVASSMFVLLALVAAPAFAQSTQDTIDAVLPRMVKIFGAGGVRNLAAYGTGFLVTPQGHVVTVWSHVLDTDQVTVVLNDGRRYQAKVLGAEPQLDLAVIQIESEITLELPHFDLAEAGSAGPGTRILGFSNMFKVAVGDEPVSVLHGVIATRSTLQARRGAFEVPYDGPVYVVDAITNNPGAGGGVITTRDGQLLGMIGKELRNAETNTWINYAVPVTELREAIEQIISGDFTPREKQDPEDNPNRYAALDFGLVMVPDVLYRTPAYIDSILPGSTAAKTDLRRDDLVLFVNDELVHSCRTLREQLGRLEAGDTLRLIVRRGNRLVTVELPVEKKGED